MSTAPSSMHTAWLGARVVRGLLAWLLCLAATSMTHAAPWEQDQDLAALGSLDSLLHDLPDLPEISEMGDGRSDLWVKAQGVPAWQSAEPDPQLYLLTELDRSGPTTRVKRDRVSRESANSARVREMAIRRDTGSGNTSPRLSIVNPLEVLRQRLLLEIARRRKWQPQSEGNRHVLDSVGKRAGRPVMGPLTSRCMLLLGRLGDDSNTLPYWKRQEKMALIMKLIMDGKCDFDSDDPIATDQLLAEQRAAAESDRAVQQQNQNRQQQQQQQQQPRDVADEQHADSTGWRRRVSGWSRSRRATSISNLAS